MKKPRFGDSYDLCGVKDGILLTKKDYHAKGD